jgi:hypothetical protein
MDFTEGMLYQVAGDAHHPHYRKIRGQVVTYTGSPTENLASVTDRQGTGWLVYKRDLTLYEPASNIEAAYLLRQEEEIG